MFVLSEASVNMVLRKLHHALQVHLTRKTKVKIDKTVLLALQESIVQGAAVGNPQEIVRQDITAHLSLQ
jgi:hypothetical protein